MWADICRLHRHSWRWSKPTFAVRMIGGRVPGQRRIYSTWSPLSNLIIIIIFFEHFIGWIIIWIYNSAFQAIFNSQYVIFLFPSKFLLLLLLLYYYYDYCLRLETQQMREKIAEAYSKWAYCYAYNESHISTARISSKLNKHAKQSAIMVVYNLRTDTPV